MLDILNGVYEQLDRDKDEDKDGNIDMSKVDVADIQKLIPPTYARP